MSANPSNSIISGQQARTPVIMSSPRPKPKCSCVHCSPYGVPSEPWSGVSSSLGWCFGRRRAENRQGLVPGRARGLSERGCRRELVQVKTLGSPYVCARAGKGHGGIGYDLSCGWPFGAKWCHVRIFFPPVFTRAVLCAADPGVPSRALQASRTRVPARGRRNAQNVHRVRRCCAEW